MSPNDKIEAGDEMTTEVTQSNAVKWVKVKVLAENGIFKNGVHYDEGSVAHFSRQAAERFAVDKDVQILGDVEVEVHQTKNAEGQVLSHLDKVVVKDGENQNE